MKFTRRDTLFRLPLAATLVSALGRTAPDAVLTAAEKSLSIPLVVLNRTRRAQYSAPVRRGVPFPKGVLRSAAHLVLRDESGAAVPTQTRLLATWNDGSIRWLLVDWLATAAADGTTPYTLTSEAPRVPAESDSRIRIAENADAITVSTGPLRFRVSKRRFSLIEEASVGTTDRRGRFREAWKALVPDPRRDAVIAIEESFADSAGQRYDYGLGGDCLASLGSYSARVEESGPLSAVIRCDGTYRLASPMGPYAAYEPFRFTVRLYCCAGQASLRFLHTFVVTHAVDQIRVKEIALRIPHSLGDGVRLFGTDAAEGVIETGAADVCMAQHHAEQWAMSSGASSLARGARAPGWGAVLAPDRQTGLLIAVRHFRTEAPQALTLGSRETRLSLWYGEGDQRLSFRRYSPVLHREEYEGIFSDGLGVAKTSEFHLSFWCGGVTEPAARTVALDAAALLQPMHVRVDPAWCDTCGVAGGGLAPADAAAHPREEQMMGELLAWMERHVAHHGWYGRFDHGDLQAGYDTDKDEWRKRGGWGWNNSEWEFRHGVWIQYLRTGDPKWFDWAEVCTRHSVDVDTCHYHPLRPYFVGGSYRHGVQHWSDEPGGSHTFIESWLDYYYLTGDARTRDVIEEAGGYFLRFAWTHHPRVSFSLRTVANIFRGLVHLYELTWDARYLRRADHLLDDVILPGQNPDGSWYKRFVTTGNRVPEYLPFGLATEGQTTAIEIGTMPPFNERELARFNRAPSRPENTPEELVGYQSHYLMVGLEQYVRLTGRADVKRAFLGQLDWFCAKGPEGWELEAGILAPRHLRQAVAQQYYGIQARECAFGFRLTGDGRYLDVGRAIVEHLIARQDRSDLPLRRGSVLTLHPLVIGTLFWGVPYFIKVEQEQK